MQYKELKYVSELQDPTITIETNEIIAKVIDNTGLELAGSNDHPCYFARYVLHNPVPFSHHLGYHGIRTFYNKKEKRNLVIPWGSWLNLQGVQLEGLVNDPIDERSWAGVVRGWPVRMERRGRGALIALDPMPQTQFNYTIEFQPAEPDAIDFSVNFIFHRYPDNGPIKAMFSWPCYMNAYDDVHFFYPKGDSSAIEWSSIGEKSDAIVGEPVGYVHQQKTYYAEKQAMPLGYGCIGKRALILMFNDPRVEFFVVNAGGHFAISPVQNPAYDFRFSIDNYPLNSPVGFHGRIIYTYLTNPEQVLKRYREWKEEQAKI